MCSRIIFFCLFVIEQQKLRVCLFENSRRTSLICMHMDKHACRYGQRLYLTVDLIAMTYNFRSFIRLKGVLSLVSRYQVDHVFSLNSSLFIPVLGTLYRPFHDCSQFSSKSYIKPLVGLSFLIIEWWTLDALHMPHCDTERSLATKVKL